MKRLLQCLGLSTWLSSSLSSRQTKFEGKQETASSIENKKTALVSVTGFQFLPNEIIVEILSWLTVESLLRFKCVCKQWSAIIQSNEFVEKHLSRTTSTFCFTTSREGRILDFDGIRKRFTYLHSCNGLLLEQRISSSKYRIRNPATRQVLDLPDPQKHVWTIAICAIPSTGNYKLVSIYYGTKESESGGCEVLTLGSDDLSWRPLKCPQLYDLNESRMKLWSLPVGGVYYCFRLVEDGSSNSEVVCLDLGNECFTSFSVPHCFFPDWRRVRTVYWNGKVSLVNIVEQELIVWVLEDYKKQRWAERKIVIPLKFLKEDPNLKESLVPHAAQKGRLWFFVDYDRMMSYHIETEEVKFTRSAPEGKKILYVDFPSLLTFKGMRRENE